ncbi:GAF and ANTAR domain-containing protein [Actinomycetes bacterium M1A6_2h]
MSIDSESTGFHLGQALAEATRTFFKPTSVDETLAEVTRSATALIDGATAADVLVVAGRRSFESHAATSELVARLDSLQEELQEGPCVDAARRDVFVRCDDFSTDTRWPRFGPRAVEIGVRSGLSFQLYTEDDTLGALNIFSTEANAFDLMSEEIGAMLATHAAVALYAANKNRQFVSALATRDLIGQAKGMLMERYRIDAVQAFALLAKLSQDNNTPVAQLAAELISLGSEAPQS